MDDDAEQQRHQDGTRKKGPTDYHRHGRQCNRHDYGFVYRYGAPGFTSPPNPADDNQ